MTATSLEVAGLDDEGRGTGEVEGATWHVGGALPGDRVRATVEHRSPHRPEAWARLVALERPSVDRVAPVCPATGRCGGCPLGALRYEAQAAWKAARLERALARVPGAPPPAPFGAAPAPTGYRGSSKLVYGIATPGAWPTLGGYAPRSHAVVDLAGCKVVRPVLEAVRGAVLAVLRDARIEPHDEAAGAGDLAYVVLRAGARDDVMVTLVGPDLDRLAALGPAIAGAHAAIAGVAANRRPRGNAIFGGETRALVGATELVEAVGPVQVLLSPTAFFQVNREVAARIYADLADFVVPRAGGAVIDAYAGVGGIALTLAARGVADVTGLELNADAVRDAVRAAARAGVGARFVAADAADGLLARAAEGPIDAVVVNPPRRGLDGRMAAALGRARPRLLAYVSCDPDTLARDLERLSADGLRIASVRGYDMHPQTPHVEALALLERGLA